MIRVSVMYANGPDAQFDHAYYATKHCPMVAEKLRPFGCKRVEVDKGLGGATPKAEAPFVAMCHIILDSLEGFQTGMKEHGKEIMADVPNYTTLTPQVQGKRDGRVGRVLNSNWCRRRLFLGLKRHR